VKGTAFSKNTSANWILEFDVGSKSTEVF